MSDRKMTQGIRVGVIGLGRMGARHLEAVSRLNMDVVGLADVSLENGRAAAARLNLEGVKVFEDATAMLGEVLPEAVVVATTAPSHCSLVLAAIEVGARLILCEKPLASSLAEVDVMRSAVDASGVAFAVNHQMRYMPNYIRIRELMERGDLGPLISMIVAGSNFGLAMNASHYFEAFRWLTGAPVASVCAQFDSSVLSNPRGPQFEDRSGRLVARGRDGQGLYIDFSGEAGWGLQVVYVFRSGQVVVDQLNGDLRIAVRQAEYRDLPTSRYGMPVDISREAIPPTETVESTMAVWRAMVAGVGYPDLDVGEHALSCLVAAHASDREGGAPVSLTLSPDLRHEHFPWA